MIAIYIILVLITIALILGGRMLNVTANELARMDVRIERIERHFRLKSLSGGYRYTNEQWSNVGVVFPGQTSYNPRGSTAEEANARNKL